LGKAASRIRLWTSCWHKAFRAAFQIRKEDGNMRFAILAVMALVTGCASAPMSTGSHCTVPQGALDGLVNFTWRAVPPVDLQDQTGYVSPVIVKKLEQTVIAELGRKGYGFNDGSLQQAYSDVEVALTFRTRREVASFTTETTPCESSDCWERVDLGSAQRMELRTVGFLAADVYYLGEPVWRGWVERVLYPEDRDHADKVLAEAIPVLFESFPP